MKQAWHQRQEQSNRMELGTAVEMVIYWQTAPLCKHIRKSLMILQKGLGPDERKVTLEVYMSCCYLVIRVLEQEQEQEQRDWNSNSHASRKPWVSHDGPFHIGLPPLSFSGCFFVVTTSFCTVQRTSWLLCYPNGSQM